jgi:hypothetical protein
MTPAELSHGEGRETLILVNRPCGVTSHIDQDQGAIGGRLE